MLNFKKKLPFVDIRFYYSICIHLKDSHLLRNVRSLLDISHADTPPVPGVLGQLDFSQRCHPARVPRW